MITFTSSLCFIITIDLLSTPEVLICISSCIHICHITKYMLVIKMIIFTIMYLNINFLIHILGQMCG